MHFWGGGFGFSRGKSKVRRATGIFFCTGKIMPEGIFWAKVSPSVSLLTPKKVRKLRKVSKKRVKKLTDIIFLKEWMKALSVSFHLTPVLTRYLLRFGNGMHLSKKSRYKTNHLLEKSILSIADLISSFKRQASILISYVNRPSSATVFWYEGVVNLYSPVLA